MSSCFQHSPSPVRWVRFFGAWSIAAALGGVTATGVMAQGLSFGGMSAQSLTAADLAGLRGAGGMAGLPGISGMAGPAGISGLLAIPIGNSLPEEDPESSKADDKKQKKTPPLPPNAFQKYLLETTGQNVSLYGSDFFENLNNANNQLNRAPVSDDYVLGTGDQLNIRVWGSTNLETTVNVDRQGAISIPKLGTLQLAGVKAGQIDAVVKQFFSRSFKDIEVSVSLAKLRRITVYAVGQTRFPGSYALSSQATLTSALFASGGAAVGGSVRQVQLLRQGKVMASFDLYAFLSRGDKSADIKLQDGDVLFYPVAKGFMAFIGQVNTPGVYEVKDDKETLADYLRLAGGLPVVADPRRATLERLQPGIDQPRRVQDFPINDQSLKTTMANGDVVSVAAIVPDLANAITLRGHVAQPLRRAWQPGMRVSDLLSHNSLLISPESVRKQNEVLFSAFEQERTARQRARVPSDLAAERALGPKNTTADNASISPTAGTPTANPSSEPPKPQDAEKSAEMKERAVAVAQQGKPEIPEENLVQRIGGLIEPVNMDYAVIERIARDTLKVDVIPFNLGRMLANPKGADDLPLQAGDVITIFSAKDIRVPMSRRQVFVQVEGEVNNPGVYPVGPGDNLQTLIQKAGGTTPDAYLFATALFREEVKRSQKNNLEKLLRKLEAESSSAVSQLSQSTGASSDPGGMQARIQAIQQAQRQSLERFRTLKPEGRIALGMAPRTDLGTQDVPALRLENGDRVQIPSRPDFVHVYGSVNTESVIIYKPRTTVAEYLKVAGMGTGANPDGVILVRADGSAMTNQSLWRNDVLHAVVMPGDTIVMPEKFNRETGWSQFVRNAKDFTQIMYQLGLGAAAVRTLRQ
jgi:protein involved in polysaccharide export with SLBB domain